MKKNLVLFYSNRSEPVTAALLNQKKISLYPISLQEFLNQGEVVDEISNDSVKIHWTFPDGKTISNDRHTLIINRALGCGSELFQDFIKKDRNYAQSELWAYLFFALNSFPKITSVPNSYTLCGGGYPLPRQWEAVKSIGMHVPEYYLGNMKSLPKDWNKNEVVCSTIQNSYFWKEYYKKNAGFAFKKPSGDPFLAFIRGNKGSLHTMDNLPLKLQKSTEKMMISMAQKVNGIFKFPIAEILFFLNGKQLTFGMIQHVPYGISLTENFQNSIVEWVETL